MARQRILFRVPLCKSFVRETHVFKYSPLTLPQLEDHLIKSVQYEEGLVVVNKPEGICYERGLVNADSLNPGSQVNIKSALPALKKHLNVKDLFHIKIPERHISGVTVLADDKKIAQDVLQWLRVMRERRELSDLYHAIVIGQPYRRSYYFDGTIGLVAKNNVKRVVFSEQIGRNAVKRGEVNRVTVEHKTLATTDDASFLEVKASRVRWNCIRAYLATQAVTPVLGDTLYGCYVRRLLGSQVPVDVFSKTQLPLQKLPEGLKKKLNIENRRDIVVPLHLHLSTVRLMKNRREVFEFSVPYPEAFRWSLEQLGLSLEKSQSSLVASTLS